MKSRTRLHARVQEPSLVALSIEAMLILIIFLEALRHIFLFMLMVLSFLLETYTLARVMVKLVSIELLKWYVLTKTKNLISHVRN
jgi:hypothetical protein